jgi:hypothetical protein
MEITPMDIINAYRKYGPIDIRRLPELIESEQKQTQNTMKYYKVVTDCLKPLGLKRSDVFQLGYGLMPKSYSVILVNAGAHVLFMPSETLLISDAILAHPDWFQEIKDSPKEYTKEDMLSFGEEVDNACTAIIGVNSLFHSWKIKNHKS